MSGVVTRREMMAWALAVVLAVTVVVTVRPDGAEAGGGGPTTDVVFIATGENFPDAFAAAPAAALGIGPVLLVQFDSIPPETLAELNRLEPAEIFIVGGTAVVSDGVKTTLEDLDFGPTVTRLAGVNRFATAAEVSEAVFPHTGFLGTDDKATDAELLDGMDSTEFLGSGDKAADSELVDGLDSSELEPSTLCDPGGVFVGFGRSGAACRQIGNVQTVDDSSAEVGLYTSVVLDSSEFPVISYQDNVSDDLKVAHCNDTHCAGGDESIQVVDGTDLVGQYTSLVLDASGNPVISYRDDTNDDLKVAHCNDPDCAGGDESIETVDSDGDVGWFTSLALDASGFPVISYQDADNGDLKVAHCNDPDCAGGDESIQTVDAAVAVGLFTSLALDASGFPVISYYDAGNGDLKVAHCNDPDCAGGDDSLETVDSAGFVGRYTSLMLDASGNPVVAYRDVSNSGVKVAHCNDPDCAGGDESIQTVDSADNVGIDTSMVLDASGLPVISYRDATNGDLKVAFCNDPDCAGGDESIQIIDEDGFVDRYTSLVLDASGGPVVSHWDASNGNLKVATP